MAHALQRMDIMSACMWLMHAARKHLGDLSEIAEIHTFTQLAELHDVVHEPNVESTKQEDSRGMLDLECPYEPTCSMTFSASITKVLEFSA